MAQVFVDLVYAVGNCLSCFPGAPTLQVNTRNFKVLRLLGEGGFSYVYLVQDLATSELFALKKIRCPFGAESVAQAMREVNAYSLFSHTSGIIHSVDYTIATDRGAGTSGLGGSEPTKVVYVLLPYFKRGNLQDVINSNIVNHTSFPPKKLMMLFLGVCHALRAMHQYRPDTYRSMHTGYENTMSDWPNKGRNPARGNNEHSGRSGANEGSNEEADPLMSTRTDASGGNSPPKSFAHRDIKPGNIMIDDSGNPLLMDLGSMAESPITITSRSLAIATQDTAAEHSTMPYRAPELFDVKTGSVIDTKVDIWSLGCTLYACLVGKSPFEARSDETGGSLSLCVLGGDWRFPDEGTNTSSTTVSTNSKNKPSHGDSSTATMASSAPNPNSSSIPQQIKDIVRKCLKVEPDERPDIDGLIDMVEGVIAELPDD